METIPLKKHPVLEGIEFGIGTWAWGDQIFWGYGRSYQADDCKEAFNYSISAGITFFDTAEVYGQGQSESLLGEFIKTTTQPVKIATKFMPYPWRVSKSTLMKALQRSLKRLGLEKIDLYQIHHPYPFLTVETWMDALAEAFHSGLISATGVSNYDRIQTQRAYDELTRQGVNLASNQVEYHLLNRKIEHNGLMDLCNQLGVTIIAYSPLAQGILSGKYTPEKTPPGVRGARYNRKYLVKIQPLLDELKKIGADHAGKTPAQVALNWVMCKGAIPIPGVKNLNQAEQNAGCLGWRLTDEDVHRLDEISNQVVRNE
jgi:aryl-alcohol dehydrogenase-like predicted oxidoreductase